MSKILYALVACGILLACSDVASAAAPVKASAVKFQEAPAPTAQPTPPATEGAPAATADGCHAGGCDSGSCCEDSCGRTRRFARNRGCCKTRSVSFRRSRCCS